MKDKATARLFRLDVFTLAMLVKVGVLLERAAILLAQNGLLPETRRVMATLGQGNTTLVYALQKEGSPEYWSAPSTKAFVRAGCDSGMMGNALGQLVKYLDYQYLTSCEEAVVLNLMGQLLAADIPILMALDIAAKSTERADIRSALTCTISAIRDHQMMICMCPEFIKVFGPYTTSIVAAGENEGYIYNSFLTVSVLLEKLSLVNQED